MHHAPTPLYGERVGRVIQIRDVPDDVHRELSEAAKARGMSLTRYALHELLGVAAQLRTMRHNADVVRQAKAVIGHRVTREETLAALHEGRGE